MYSVNIVTLLQERETTSSEEIWLAIQEEGVAILEYSTMVL
jgi:hypothetical protein